MYLDHFGLVTDPFSLTPRLDFLFASTAFEESLAHLAYSLENGEAITLITGPIGIGKTLAIHGFLAQLGPTFKKALVNTTQLSYPELLKLILNDLGVSCPSPSDRADLLRMLKEQVADSRKQGRRILIVIDEAQDLTSRTLESLRLMTNIDQLNDQGLQLILIGQPDLEGKVRQPELLQLDQRIRVRYRLEPLTRRELSGYVEHRMQVAGCEQSVFKKEALDRIYAQSKGIPRLVNIMADDALMNAYLDDSREVRGKHVEERSMPAVTEINIGTGAVGDARVAEAVVEDRFREVSPAVDRSAARQERPLDGGAVFAEVPRGRRDAAEVSPAAKPVPRPRRPAESAVDPSHLEGLTREPAVELAREPVGAAAVAGRSSQPASEGPGPGSKDSFEAWTPTVRRHRQRRVGGWSLMIVLAGLLVVIASAWFFMGWRRDAGPTSATAHTETPIALADQAGADQAGADRADAGADRSTGPVDESSLPMSGDGDEAEDRVEEDVPPVPDPVTPPPEQAMPSGSDPAADLSDGSGFAVHVSSFRDSERALRMCEQLRQSGHTAFSREETIKGSLWHRVFVGPFAEKASAQSAIDVLREGGFKSYFMVMKLDNVR